MPAIPRGTYPILFIGAGAPTGFAAPHQFYVNTSNGDLYDSFDGAWHLVSGGTGGGFLNGANVQAGDYTATVDDDGKLVVMTKATAKTLTLPVTPPSTTWAILVQNTGAGTLTVNRNGKTIDGAASNLTLLQNDGIVLFTDGSNYFTERGVVPANQRISTITLVIDGGGVVPATGAKAPIQVKFDCTIVDWTVVADQAGDCQVTISAGTYAAFPTASSIVAAAPPKLVATTQKNTDSTLSGWTTAIAADTMLQFNLDSVHTCTRITLELKVQRT